MFTQTVYICLSLTHFENHQILEPVCANVRSMLDFLSIELSRTIT